MYYEKKFLIGDYVKGKRTFNGEVIEGKFNGFRLYNKLNPESVVGVIDTDERCYDVSVDSIELVESEDEKIRKELIERFKWELKGAEEQDAAGCSRQKDIAMFKRGIAWLEKQGEQKPYPETLDKAIELYYYSYGNQKNGFDNLSLEQFKDIIKTFIEDYGNKSALSEDDVAMIHKDYLDECPCCGWSLDSDGCCSSCGYGRK